jgi:thioredoxin reductase (NADPH)
MLILGGGPAGLTAGIYGGRAQLKVAMLERLMPGGQVAGTDWVENYPGFEEGVSGFDLMQKMEKQAKRFDLEILSGEVSELDLTSVTKRIVAGGREYLTKTVIIATGNDPKLLNIPGEEKFKGRGVSYCATCDGPFFKDKTIAVIGGGSSGVQESLYLTRFVTTIHLVEFLDHLTAEPILQRRARDIDKFHFYLNHRVISINGEDRVSSITIQDRDSEKQKELTVDGVFIWVGLKPNTGFVQNKLDLDEWGYIKTDEDLNTSVSGVFAAGDVRSKSVRQITTAVADGTIAAESALKYLESQK